MTPILLPIDTFLAGAQSAEKLTLKYSSTPSRTNSLQQKAVDGESGSRCDYTNGEGLKFVSPVRKDWPGNEPFQVAA
jgi:hypothetical protein